MALVAVMIFFAIRFISDKRAAKLAIGICMVLFILLISQIFRMSAMNFLLSNITQVGIIILVVVFQPELRSALEKIGGAGKELKILPGAKDSKGNKRGAAMNTLCEAVQELANDSTGALIVIERDTPLGDIIKTGTVVNADIGVAMIKNIFYNKAPLHDGAMIIRNQRVFAAGCFLPLSTKDDIVKNLGTRHRAAIGMSENSDAIVIVVSEETGTISIAVDGKLRRNYDCGSLKKALNRLLNETSESEKSNSAVEPRKEDTGN
jgi:diadenylate cyclase